MKPRLDFEIYNKEELLAHVQVVGNEVIIKQYTEHPIYKQFKQEPVTLSDVADWLESRCFPENRFNKQEVLRSIGLEYYSPIAIVKRTHGLLHEDYIWIKFKGENITLRE